MNKNVFSLLFCVLYELLQFVSLNRTDYYCYSFRHPDGSQQGTGMPEEEGRCKVLQCICLQVSNKW